MALTPQPHLSLIDQLNNARAASAAKKRAKPVKEEAISKGVVRLDNKTESLIYSPLHAGEKDLLFHVRRGSRKVSELESWSSHFSFEILDKIIDFHKNSAQERENLKFSDG